MSLNATVRMRDESWELDPAVAERLEREGTIWRDHDCDQNTIDNGYPNEGPCYGVSGESESDEESRNADEVNRWSIVEPPNEWVARNKWIEY